MNESKSSWTRTCFLENLQRAAFCVTSHRSHPDLQVPIRKSALSCNSRKGHEFANSVVCSYPFPQSGQPVQTWCQPAQVGPNWFHPRLPKFGANNLCSEESSECRMAAQPVKLSKEHPTLTSRQTANPPTCLGHCGWSFKLSLCGKVFASPRASKMCAWGKLP